MTSQTTIQKVGNSKIKEIENSHMKDKVNNGVHHLKLREEVNNKEQNRHYFKNHLIKIIRKMSHNQRMTMMVYMHQTMIQ